MFNHSTHFRLTCQLAITDLNFTALPSEPSPPVCHHDKQARRVSVVEPSRRRSVVGEPPTSSSGQCTVTELNFGFSVDMQSKSNKVQKMSNIVARFEPADHRTCKLYSRNLECFRDNVKRSEFPAATVAGVAQDLELEGLRKATTVGGGQASPLSDIGQQENFDTYSSILNFTQQHEALMAFYYLDEHKQVKVNHFFRLHNVSSR